MNKAVIGALSFIGGAICAGTGMYFYMKSWADKKINEECDKFKADLKIAGHAADDISRSKDSETEPEITNHQNDARKLSDAKSSLTGPIKRERTDYHKISKSYYKSLEDLEEASKSAEDILAEAEHPEDDPPEEDDEVSNRISLIAASEYERLSDDYDMESGDGGYFPGNLIWYIEEDKLFDAEMDEIEQPSLIVGEVLENCRDDILSQPERDGDLLFILNEGLRTCYEVEIIFGEID